MEGEIVNISELKPWEMPQLPVDLECEVTVQIVTYMSKGLLVKAYLVRPVLVGLNQQTDELPGLIYCRGGIKRVGMVRIGRMAQLAANGYVVLAPVYRGNLGGEGHEDFAGEDRHDLFNAIRVMRELPGVKRAAVPLIGFSRGAVMALRAAAECEGVGPVAVWGGVSDMELTYEERIDLRRMLKRVVGHPRKDLEAYRERSPRLWAERINSPVMIVHGTDDQQVSVKHAHLLADALEKAGKLVEMRLYDGLGHVFPPNEDRDALRSIFDWIGQVQQAVDEDVKS